jgi:hypothetical protein
MNIAAGRVACLESVPAAAAEFNNPLRQTSDIAPIRHNRGERRYG